MIKNLAAFILGAILGFISVITPPILLLGVEFYQLSFFEVVGIGIEKLSLWAMVCLFLSGAFPAFLRPKHVWLWGLATMSLFPIVAFVEMLGDSYSHNLWPFEFVIYGFLTIPGILGAYTGAFIRRKFSKSNKT